MKRTNLLRTLAVICGIALAVLAIIFIPTQILLKAGMFCISVGVLLGIVYAIVVQVRKYREKKNNTTETPEAEATNSTGTASAEAEATNSETEETVDEAEETPATPVAPVCDCKEAGAKADAADAKKTAEALEKRVAKLEEAEQAAAAKSEAEFTKKCDADSKIKALRAKIEELNEEKATSESLLKTYFKDKAKHQIAEAEAEKEFNEANTALSDAKVKASALGKVMNKAFENTSNITGKPEADAAEKAYLEAKAKYDAAVLEEQALHKRIYEGVDNKPSLEAILKAANAEVAKDNANIADTTQEIQDLQKEIDACNSEIQNRIEELRAAE